MSDRFQNIATELADAGRAFHGRSWMLGTSGNLSAVVDHDPFRLAITRSGVDKGSLTPEQIPELDGDGNKVAEYPGHPSAETRLHLAVVRSRDAGAVFHTHSMWATIVSEGYGDQRGLWIEGYEMLKGLEGVATHEHSEWIPILENSQDMAELADRIDQVPQDKKVLFICAAGVRSGLACELAVSLGYGTENIFNIEDGTPFWIEGGHPTSYGDDP